MISLFSKRFLLVELLADVLAVLVAVGMCLVLNFPQWAAPLWAPAWLIFLFGPGVWALGRMWPVMRRMSARQLREDIALTPIKARPFLEQHIRSRLLPVLLPPVIMLVLGLTLIVLGHYQRLYNLMFAPLIVLWYADQVMAGILLGLIGMRALMRPRQRIHETLWFAGAMAALLGLMAGMVLGSFFLLRLIGLGAMVVPFVVFMALPLLLYDLVKRQWEAICREYFLFE